MNPSLLPLRFCFFPASGQAAFGHKRLINYVTVKFYIKAARFWTPVVLNFFVNYQFSDKNRNLMFIPHTF